jgi:ribonuclease R
MKSTHLKEASSLISLTFRIMSKGKKNKAPKGGGQRRDLRQEVMEVFYENPGKPMNYKQVAGAIGVRDNSLRDVIAAILEEEAGKDKLIMADKGRYQLPATAGDMLEGRIEITKYGRGFVIIEGVTNDLQIPRGETGTALYGDRVQVSVSTKHRKRVARVVEVVQRARKQYICIFDQQRHLAFGLPTDQKIHIDFFLPPDNRLDASHGDKIVVEIESWDDPADSPVGKVVKVLGKPGNNDVEMHAIMIEYGLPYEFPEEVLDEADGISKVISPDEIARRRDMRGILTFTIDPADAKDFDDALSLRRLETGNWEVGVHIADVTHYMKPGTILDDEAYQRATSVYLVDRTVPMLPEILSNELCSLKPHEDKLCFSAIFELDEEANVINSWFGRTIIHSDHRFAYEDAQVVIETKQGTHADAILTLNDLAFKLRDKRFARGGIDFNTEEVKFQLDENGKPIGVYVKEMKEANKLIEDFMLLANIKVAERVGKVQGNQTAPPFVYRVHDHPEVDRLIKLREFVSRFGYKMPKPNPESAENAIKNLLKAVEGTPEEDVIKVMAIRTMAKAEYSVNNIGHYGLAFPFYSHFTSPIRRYPDVMVHRLLQHYLDGGDPVNATDYEFKCRHSSEQEKKAAEAERASIKYKQVEFLLSRIGENFRGMISGVTSWGIYVELEGNKCEGMVRLDSMTDDHYMFDEERMCLIGKRRGQEYHFGDQVTIRVIGADLMKRQLNFALSEQA